MELGIWKRAVVGGSENGLGCEYSPGDSVSFERFFFSFCGRSLREFESVGQGHREPGGTWLTCRQVHTLFIICLHVEDKLFKFDHNQQI